jgi:hypothetical protein
MTRSFAEAEMLEGYYDGLRDERVEFPAHSNHSEAYQHGWLNGRDDRIKQPRLFASELRTIAARILDEADA